MSDEKGFNARIEGPRKTHEAWLIENPVLLYGERVTVIMPDGYIRHKTGDGVATYSMLQFDEAECLDRMVLAAPALNETKMLTAAGYYYAYAEINNSNYSFGLFYWDGGTKRSYIAGPYDHKIWINPDGSIYLYDANLSTPSYTLYTVRIQ